MSRWLLVLLLAGCSSPPPPEPTPAPEVAKSDFLDVMHSRLAGFGDLQSALIDGDLKAAQAVAADLASATIAGEVPSKWRPWAESLDRGLAAVQKGPLEAATKGAAAAVASCGGCHAEAGARVSFHPAAHPPRTPGGKAHMQRHAVGATLMFEALVANDDARWGQAMIWLAQPPVEQGELTEGYALDPASQELEAQVHSLAAGGQTAEAGARPVLYAELLTACASCHRSTGGGPAADRDPSP